MKKQQLIESSNMKFPDNNSGAIIPAEHRAFNNQIIGVIFENMPKYYVRSMTELLELSTLMEAGIPVEITVYVTYANRLSFPVGDYVGDRIVYFPENTPVNSRMIIYNESDRDVRFMLKRGSDGEGGLQIPSNWVGMVALESNTPMSPVYSYYAMGAVMQERWMDM